MWEKLLGFEKGLATTLMLPLQEGTQGFLVHCDASKDGMGFVLMYNDKVIPCASRELNIHERNFPTHDFELAFVVFPFKIWHDYLYDVHVDVSTNHKILL